MQSPDGQLRPLAGPQDDGHDDGLAPLMPLQGDGQFIFPDEIRVNEIGADEQQDDIGAAQLAHDFVFPYLAGQQFLVAPVADFFAAAQGGEVGADAALQVLVLMGVGDEDGFFAEYLVFGIWYWPDSGLAVEVGAFGQFEQAVVDFVEFERKGIVIEQAEALLAGEVGVAALQEQGVVAMLSEEGEGFFGFASGDEGADFLFHLFLIISIDF